jgi:predicted ATPase
MLVTSLEIENFRSFESMGPIELDRINVLVGPNNSGKSSILRALHQLQIGAGGSDGNIFADVRVNTSLAKIIIGLEAVDVRLWAHVTENGNVRDGKVRIFLNSSDRKSGNRHLAFLKNDGSDPQIEQIRNIDPQHFIIPYLSKRKVAGYDENVRTENTVTVRSDFSFLSGKISRIATYGYPGNETYRQTCEKILGFMITVIHSDNGQRPGIYLQDGQSIPIDQMGEGVPHIASLLADLAMSSGKLFLIEELENDLHPEALKALLDLILESSEKNQFVISTHSNIVVRHLVSAPNSKLYNVTSEINIMPPAAKIREVERSVEARLKILQDLGYSFSDLDLWDGWLILEESSAERIIRDYLIPWFAPKLTRIRTVSTGGVNQVEPTFDDFNRLVRFTHLEEAYRNAAWVRVDGDKPGTEIINRLRERYPSWSQDRFKSFEQSQFEHYYPSDFSDQVIEVLSIENKKEKREAKRKLLDQVRAWLDENEQRGREALKQSAQEIIADLRSIENQLFS